MLTPSQEMFMLFFSILYGIMLNSLIGLGAFPIAYAWAREGIIDRDMSGGYFVGKTKTSLIRFLLSLGLLNVLPLGYFVWIFQSISSVETVPTLDQIVSLALSSWSVFAFFQFFLACATCRWIRKYIYTPFHFRRLRNEKGFHPNPWYHLLAGITYLGIPLFVFIRVFLRQ